jgi:hypothetical protein
MLAQVVFDPTASQVERVEPLHFPLPQINLSPTQVRLKNIRYDPRAFPDAWNYGDAIVTPIDRAKASDRPRATIRSG